MKLHFLGAAREVTGSCFLVEALNVRFLVDCGMVQGGRTAAARNHGPFPFDPASIDFVLLTHAHIDHSGLLPKLTRAGFKGAIYATPATVDLLGVMLPDSAHIQESDAKRNAQRLRGKDALPPLYTLQDASDCLQQVRGIEYDREFAPRVGVRARFRDAGHILGSAIIEVWVTEHGDPTKLVFSGDLGQPGRPILRDPTTIEDADILIMDKELNIRAVWQAGKLVQENFLNYNKVSDYAPGIVALELTSGVKAVLANDHCPVSTVVTIVKADEDHSPGIMVPYHSYGELNEKVAGRLQLATPVHLVTRQGIFPDTLQSLEDEVSKHRKPATVKAVVVDRNPTDDFLVI